MKKIIHILLIAVLALSFMGCPTAHSDADWLTTIYVHAWGGSADSFAWQDGSSMTFDNATGVYTYTFKSTKLDGVILLNGAWNDEAKFGGGNLPGIPEPGVYEIKNEENGRGWFWKKTGTADTVVIKYDMTTYTKDFGEAEQVADITWPPVSVPVGHFAVKVKGLSYGDGEKTWNSNISWGGAVGTWAGKDMAAVTSGITVDVKNGEGVMYISNNYAADGWATKDEEKPEDKTVNFKLQTGDGGDKWFKLEVPASGYCELDWTTGK